MDETSSGSYLERDYSVNTVGLPGSVTRDC
jgi:hypothetical protein